MPKGFNTRRFQSKPALVGFAWAIAATSHLAAQAAATSTIDRAAVQQFLEQLDRSLEQGSESGDFATYQRAFEPLHPQKFDRRLDWIRTLFSSAEQKLQVRSSIRDFDTVAGHGLVLVETTIRSARSTPVDTWTSVRYLAVATLGDRLAGVLDVDVHESSLGKRPLSESSHSRFGCGACNYEIRASDDWLMVPHAPERVGCIEAVSFYSLRGDLVIDSSIHVVDEDRTPAAVLRALVVRRTAADQSVPRIETWTPPHYEDMELRGLTGARAISSSRDGRSAALYAARFGPVLYLFTALCDTADVEAHADRVQDLLATFMLKETDLGRLQRTLRPIAMHTGGSLVDGVRYENRRHGVFFDGPTGWDAKLRCGAYLFHVSYHCGATLRTLSLRSMAPPPGHIRWTKKMAAWSVDYAMHRRGMETLEDSGWVGSDVLGWRRDVIAADFDDNDRQIPSSTRRACRAVLPADAKQLVIIDTTACLSQIGAMQKMFDDLRIE